MGLDGLISASEPRTDYWQIVIVASGGYATYLAIRSAYSRDFRRYLLNCGYGLAMLGTGAVGALISSVRMGTSTLAFGRNLLATTRELIASGSSLVPVVTSAIGSARTLWE